MALRSLARKLTLPAAAALKQASGPRVSPAAGSRLPASQSYQSGEGRRVAKGVGGAPTLSYREKAKQDMIRMYLREAGLINSLPTITLPVFSVVSSAAGFFFALSGAYAVGAIKERIKELY
ncbi:hypothetical protein ACP70R_014486 [Stipagrostis hirtigluma subsp. patula]